MDKKIELLPHNEVAYKKLIKSLETNQLVSINHATGTGKSFIILKYLYENKYKRILYLAPTYQIIDQLVGEHIKELDIKMDEFKVFDTLIYPNLLSKNIDSLKDKYDIIILDEYHRCGAKKWGKKVFELINKIKEENKEVKIIGTTATEIRYLDNNRNMNNILFDGVCASTITLADAILDGILPPPIYINYNFELLFELENLYKKIKRLVNYQENLDKYFTIYKEIRNEIETSLASIINYKKYLKENGKYLVFSRTKKQIKLDKEVISKMIGVRDEYVITSDNKPEKNNSILRSFREDKSLKNKVLYSIQILNEGVHVKDVDAIFMLRHTSSPIIYFQQLGRLLSYSRRNDKVVIFDLVNNIKNHEVIFNLYIEIVERAKKLLETDPKNKERYLRIIDTLKIVDPTTKIVEKIEKFKEMTSDDNLYLERLKTSVSILEHQEKYDYQLVIKAYVDIFKYQEYITLDLYDRIRVLDLDKPKIFSFSREYFNNYLAGYSNIKEKKSDNLNNLVNEILEFYDNNFHIPSIFSTDFEEKNLAKKLLLNFDSLNKSQKSKIKKYLDDDISSIEYVTYNKNYKEVDFKKLYEEIDFMLNENILISDNVLDLLSIDNSKESIEYLNKIVNSNASYYVINLFESDSRLDFIDEISESDNMSSELLYKNEFEIISKKVINEFKNVNQEEYLYNLTNEIILFIQDNKRLPLINSKIDYEKELFTKRIVLKPYLEKYGYESRIEEEYLKVQLNLKKIKKDQVYVKLIEFLNINNGELPSLKSQDEVERKLALLYQKYYDSFDLENILEIKGIQDASKSHYLIVLKNYIIFIKKYKRRPIWNSKNKYEVNLYNSFLRIEPYLEDTDKELIDNVLSRIDRYKETKNLYQEMLSKRGK